MQYDKANEYQSDKISTYLIYSQTMQGNTVNILNLIILNRGHRYCQKKRETCHKNCVNFKVVLVKHLLCYTQKLKLLFKGHCLSGGFYNTETWYKLNSTLYIINLEIHIISVVEASLKCTHCLVEINIRKKLNSHYLAQFWTPIIRVGETTSRCVLIIISSCCTARPNRHT